MMKKCDQFKELILTDYIDGQMAKDAVQELEQHLMDCSDCRHFFKEVKALPFQQALNQPVPSELWDSIREGIEQDNKAGNFWKNVVDILKGWMILPKPVPVFASLVLIFMVGSVALNTVQLQQAKAKDQGEYLVAMLSPTEPTVTDSSDSDTPIEHYFL